MLARPNLTEGGEDMSNDDLDAPGGTTEEKKTSPPPHFMRKDRVKVCGKWRKKGYKPSKAEQDLWIEKCKVQNRDPKTGQIKAAKKDKK